MSDALGPGQQWARAIIEVGARLAARNNEVAVGGSRATTSLWSAGSGPPDPKTVEADIGSHRIAKLPLAPQVLATHGHCAIEGRVACRDIVSIVSLFTMGGI